MILFFDTETDGLPDYRMPPDHESQPRLVQLACLLTDDTGAEISTFNSIVQIEGDKPIPASASNVHGITTEKSRDFGLYLAAANYMWDRLAQMADTVVAHNVKFDRAIIDTSFHRRPPVALSGGRRFSLDDRHALRNWVCTMELASPIVNLPPTDRMLAAGFTKPKPPKLEECIKHFFDEELTGAHDALVDVRACARLYFHLQTLKVAA